MLWLWNRVRGGGGGSGGPPVTGPEKVLGYGHVNHWHVKYKDAGKWAACLRKHRCNTFVIEALAAGKYDFYDNPEAILGKPLRYVVDACTAEGISVLAMLVNWNKGQGHDANGERTICDVSYDSAWYQGCLDLVAKAAPDPRRVILNGVSELGARNTGCVQKGRHWLDMTHQQWKGPLGFNWPAQATSVPASYAGEWLIWHAPHANQDGPANAIWMCDHSLSLADLSDGGATAPRFNPGRVHDTTLRLLKTRTRGVAMYGFWHPAFDEAAVEAMGQAAAEAGT